MGPEERRTDYEKKTEGIMMKQTIKFSWGWMIFWSIIIFPIGPFIYPVYYIARCQGNK